MPVSINQPSRGWALPGLREVWQHRGLIASFGARDLKVRYKQTMLGLGWAVLQPLALMIVFSLFFGRVLRVPAVTVPYPVFLYSGLVLWMYFSNTVSKLGGGLIEHQGIMTKVYFPRLLIPLSGLVVGLVDLAVASAILIALMLFYHLPLLPSVLLAPLFLAMVVVTAFAVGLWLAALNVEYRDIQQLIPLLLQVWFFATPIFYPREIVAQRWWFIFSLDPLAGAAQGVRWALLGTAPPAGSDILGSMAVAAAVLIGGLVYFHRVEDRYADVV